jgi:periplasmic divalent cation tolerance protein
MMILIYITCKDREEAEKISKHLLEKKLIACANIFPIESFYWWKGKIEEDQEVVIIAKSLKKKFEEVKREVKKVHSYEIPCILQIKVEKVNEEYLRWIKKEVE